MQVTRQKHSVSITEVVKSEPVEEVSISPSYDSSAEQVELKDHDEEDNKELPQPSFNGRLQQFAYVSTKKISPTKGTLTKTTSITVTSPLKRQLSDNVSGTASPSPSPSPSKRRRKKASGYAPPSTYAHLPELVDVLEPGLICVFIGVNPGIRTAQTGHAYSHPSNLFWKLLHSSGITDRRCSPEEDRDLPRLYSLGNTNIVARPSRNQGELSKEEMDASVNILEIKVRKFRPEAVCIVGKGIWESVWRSRYGRSITKSEFRWGWQDEAENMGRDEDEGFEGAKVFVATSTSGLAASMRPPEKEAIWKPLGDWVKQRRAERNSDIA